MMEEDWADNCSNCTDECKENILELRKLDKLHSKLIKEFEKIKKQ